MSSSGGCAEPREPRDVLPAQPKRRSGRTRVRGEELGSRSTADRARLHRHRAYPQAGTDRSWAHVGRHGAHRPKRRRITHLAAASRVTRESNHAHRAHAYDCVRMPATEADVEFGALLKRARDAAGLTTAAIAEQLPAARESADRYMRGQRRPDQTVVARWEEICGLKPGSLLDAYKALPPRQSSSANGGSPRPQAMGPSPRRGRSRERPRAEEEGLDTDAVTKRSWRSRPAFQRAAIAALVALAGGLATAMAVGAPGAKDHAPDARADAGASPRAVAAAYPQAVADVCETLDANAREAAAINRRLRARLARAKSTLAQRNVLLRVQRRVHDLAKFAYSGFAGLEPPRSRRRRQRDTAAAWARNLERGRLYESRLDRVRNHDDLVSAVEFLSRSRPRVDRDAVNVSVGLVNLSDGRCHRDRPAMTPVVTLPSLRDRADSAPDLSSPRAPTVTPPPAPVTPPRPPVTPPPTPDVGPPAPPIVIEPPACSGPRC